MSGMRYPHHALGMDFQFIRLQAEVNQRALREGCIRLNVATAETQIGQFAMWNRLSGAPDVAAAALSQLLSSASAVSDKSRKCTPV